LNPREISIIKTTIEEYFPGASVYLFGSRTDPEKRGGDIDLYVITPQPDYERKLRLIARLQHRLHKPVDLLLHRDFQRPIEQEALRGIPL
jgi:predicted nucleotidyltransferase